MVGTRTHKVGYSQAPPPARQGLSKSVIAVKSGGLQGSDSGSSDNDDDDNLEFTPPERNLFTQREDEEDGEDDCEEDVDDEEQDGIGDEYIDGNDDVESDGKGDEVDSQEEEEVDPQDDEDDDDVEIEVAFGLDRYADAILGGKPLKPQHTATQLVNNGVKTEEQAELWLANELQEQTQLQENTEAPQISTSPITPRTQRTSVPQVAAAVVGPQVLVPRPAAAAVPIKNPYKFTKKRKEDPVAPVDQAAGIASRLIVDTNPETGGFELHTLDEEELQLINNSKGRGGNSAEYINKRQENLEVKFFETIKTLVEPYWESCLSKFQPVTRITASKTMLFTTSSAE